MRFARSIPGTLGSIASGLWKLLGIIGIPGDFKIWMDLVKGMRFSEVVVWLPMLLGVAWSAYLYRREIRQWTRRGSNNEESFDMPIDEAIKYLGRTVQHSFGASRRFDRVAFKMLHKPMCSGELPVIGSSEQHGVLSVPSVIPPKRCIEMTPEEQVVPIGLSAPDGVRFRLIAYADKNWLDNWDGVSQPVILEQYSDLRVRSADVYRLWPRLIR